MKESDLPLDIQGLNKFLAKRPTMRSAIAYCRGKLDEMEHRGTAGNDPTYIHFGIVLTQFQRMAGWEAAVGRTYERLWDHGAPAFLGLPVIVRHVSKGRGQEAARILDQMRARHESERANAALQSVVPSGTLNLKLAEGVVRLSQGRVDEARRICDAIVESRPRRGVTVSFDPEFLIALIRHRQYRSAQALLGFALSLSERSQA